MGKTLAVLCTLLLMGARPVYEQKLLEEMRIALVDLQQAVSTQKFEISHLQEQVGQKKGDSLLEVRIANIEKMQETFAQDLRTLASHTESVSAHYAKQIHDLNNKLQKVEELKGTLDSIASALDQGGNKHRVRSGETLEKIAREHGTSVEALKQRNHLSSSTILVGQELLLP